MTTDPLFSVADRSVFVAGAAGALGQALAYAFAERGAKIIAADIDRVRVEAVAGKLPGGGHLVHHLDVTDEASCKSALATARDALGGLDVVINGTGVFSVAPALELDAHAFDETLRVNLTGAFLQDASSVTSRQCTTCPPPGNFPATASTRARSMSAAMIFAPRSAKA